MSNEKAIVIKSNEFRQNQKKYFDEITEKNNVVLVQRPKGNNVVMMSEKEYNSIQETEYLLQNEENRKFLEQSMQQLKNKKTKMLSREEWKEIKKQEKFNKWIGRI
ncbi:MAG TPA: type II toxin-antitoxin system Phd/YefM family antitoxin [Limosilactobacillus reuteri]|nr:type II toxin-antitoxin system Phd/YefM family antitoxin [Limosilactobacillus reuteri]